MKRLVVLSGVAVLIYAAFIVGSMKKQMTVRAQATIDPCSDTSVTKSSVATGTTLGAVIIPAVPDTTIYVCGFGVSRPGGTIPARFTYGISDQCTFGTGIPLTGNLLVSTDTAPFVAGNHGQTILRIPVGIGLCETVMGGFVTYVQQ